MEAKFLGKISFKNCYDLQKELLQKKINEEIDDTILGLTHYPCITVGRQGNINDIKEKVNIPVYFIERGGRATYHGEGQLVCYFIWDIKNFGIREFLDFLEEIITLTLGKLEVSKSDIKRDLKGRGIWIKNKKIASIGISIKKWVSFHGISINIDKRIHTGFDLISPCGLNSEEICCLEHFGVNINAEETFKILVETVKEVKVS
jgi:lipoate-protein ligase B